MIKVADVKKKILDYLNSDKHNMLFGVLFIFVIIIFSLNFNFRIDLTRNDSYSLSGFSKEIVSSIQDPFYVKVFYSENVPAQYKTVRTYLQDTLEEYSNAANSNFKVDYYNTDDEDNKKLAENLGLYPVEINTRQSDEIKVQKAYMGVVLIHGDLMERINNVSSVTGLEYRISSAIQKMLGKSNALKAMKGSIEIRVYVSNGLKKFGIRGYDQYEAVVRSVYEKLNNDNFGKIKLKFVECSDLGDVSKEAEKYGLPVIPWEDTETDQGIIPAGKAILGMTVQMDDKIKSVSLGISRSPLIGYSIAGLDTLEESLSAAVDFLLINNPKVVYLSGHGEPNLNDARQGAGVLKSILSDLYNVMEVNLLNQNIPANAGTLIVNAPKAKISDYELFKIDNFIMKGGSVLFLHNSFNEVSAQGMGGQQQSYFIPSNTGIDKLLTAYGFTVGKNFIMDESCYEQSQQGQGRIVLNYVPILKGDSISQESLVTKNIKQLVMMKISSINVNQAYYESDERSYEVLLTSSNRSWLMKDRINLNPFMIYPPQSDDMFDSYTAAVKAEGIFKSAFAGKAIPKLPEKKDLDTTGTDINKGKNNTDVDRLIVELDAEERYEKSLKPGRIIVIGSGDLTSQSLLGFQDAEGGYPNIYLIQGIVDYLNRNEYIAPLRSKGLEYVPIENISSTQRSIFKIINIAGLPLLVLAIGIIISSMKKKRRMKVKKEFSGE